MPEPDGQNSDALNQLCAFFGIATHYRTISGTRLAVAPEGLVALLAEFRVRLDGEMTAAKALDAAQRRAWQQALPPATTIRAAAHEWSVTLRLPATLKHLYWQIKEESGALHQGVKDAHSFPELARLEIDGVAWCERRLPFSLALPEGYHRLTVHGLDGETLLISAPAACYRPAAVQNSGRIWGPAVQLYSLRSARNWGMGDFTDLVQLVGVMAELGAGIIGLNPLHALFSHNPAHVSPYSPSSRQHLNALYIDVEAVEDFTDCEAAKQVVLSPEFQARLAHLRESVLIDHEGVAAAKFEILELLFDHFTTQHLTPDGEGAVDGRGRAFLDFVSARGDSLRYHALFEALQARFHAAGPWPGPYRHSSSAAVEIFAARYATRVQYFQYLQWIANDQLSRANLECKARGLGVGLYLDLAVSVDRAGSDAWREDQLFAGGASVGAPPDAFNEAGQDWGLPPLLPDRMRENHYRFFIATLRANMRDAGALRIDHVMGLMRLFWVPPGKKAGDGAYVHYHLDEMVAILALESQRHRCMVIGEDLGTVADEMRTALAHFDVLSYRLLYFEQLDHGGFKAARDYPERAVVAISTHDLATLPGWWVGQDLRVRLDFGHIKDAQEFEKQLLDRAQQRVHLMQALQDAGLWSAQESAETLGGQTLSPRLIEAVHAFLAQAPAAVMITQLEDSLGVIDQINLPGTTDEHPNWRRKMPVDLEQLSKDPQIQSLSQKLNLLRPKTSRP